MARKPKISPRRPPAQAELTAFVQSGAAPKAPGRKTKGGTSQGPDVSTSGSPGAYLPERKRGFLAGQEAHRSTIYFPLDVFQKLRRHCFETGQEMSAFVTDAVRGAMKQAK